MAATKPGGFALACVGFAGVRGHSGRGLDGADRRTAFMGDIGGLGDFGGGVASGGVCPGHEPANATDPIWLSIVWVFCVGIGQDHLDRGVASGGADRDVGFELVCLGGRFCGDDQGLLAGHVAGLDEAEIEVEHLMNGL